MKKFVHWKQLIALLILGSTVGCTSKHTASFSKSAPFYTAEVTMGQLNPKIEKDPVEELQADELIATSDTKAALEELPEIQAIVKKYQQKQEDITSGLIKPSREKALKQEQKAMRKELKKELKDQVAEIKKVSREQDMSPDRKIYIGLIIGAAGLVVALLASSSIGGLAIIVGVGLIAWGLIEQGSL